MHNELTYNFIVVISNEDRNLNKIFQQISLDGIQAFEMTSTKAMCKK